MNLWCFFNEKSLKYWVEKRNSKIYIFRAKYWNWITELQIMSSQFPHFKFMCIFTRFSKKSISHMNLNSFAVFTVFSLDKTLRVSDFGKKEKKKSAETIIYTDSSKCEHLKQKKEVRVNSSLPNYQKHSIQPHACTPHMPPAHNGTHKNIMWSISENVLCIRC